MRRLVPSKDAFPEEIKTAAVVNQGHLDEDFALILRSEDGSKKRKYACIDAGNTMLSVLYFMEQRDRLPEEMRKVAAKNLVDACMRHGIAAPAVLEKQAGDEGGIVYFPEEYLEEDLAAEPVHTTSNGFPLDTFEEVKQASAAFLEGYKALHPRARRLMALDIEKRASALGIDTSPEISRYAGTGYSRDLGVGIEIRESLLPLGARHHGGYSELYKRASVTPPEAFAEALAELDVRSGLSEYWDGYVPDPYFTTFDKIAEHSEFEHTDGVDKVTATDLQRLADNGRSLLLENFPEDLVDGFGKDPVGIFKSLPVPQKKMIMRMAQG